MTAQVDEKLTMPLTAEGNFVKYYAYNKHFF
jgi:hypothetical protein